MKFNKLTFLLVILALLLPVAAIGNNINVRTNNVRASTSRNGSVYVQTGNTGVQLPSRRSSFSWYPWQFWRHSWLRRSNCQNRVYQRNTQTMQSGGRVVSSNISTSSTNCR